MNDWKNQLFDSYVSSGQATGDFHQRPKLSPKNFPYFQRLIKQRLPDNIDAAIVDIACGYGALLYCLRESGYRNIKGIDVSSEQVELAHNLGAQEAKCGDMFGFLKENANSFDVVFLMDILEHLEREELFKLLRLVNISLKNEGLVIVHVPNGAGLFGMRIRYGDLTHENCFTAKSIRQTMGGSGFCEIRCFEDKPIIHGISSFLRFVLWNILIIPHKLLLIAETGQTDILSQNILVVARKAPAQKS